MTQRGHDPPPPLLEKGTTAAPRRLVTLLGAPAPTPIADDASHALVVSDEQHRAADPLDSSTDTSSVELHDILPLLPRLSSSNHRQSTNPATSLVPAAPRRHR
jgi:hypothetical protein